MNETIFRKKSLERVNSPEALDDYIQVTNPGVWMVLVCMILLLTGACAWGVMGRMESTISTTVLVESGNAACTIPMERVTSIAVGMAVHIGDAEGTVSSITANPEADTYWVKIDAPLADGIYAAEIVTESIRPFSLVFG